MRSSLSLQKRLSFRPSGRGLRNLVRSVSTHGQGSAGNRGAIPNEGLSKVRTFPPRLKPRSIGGTYGEAKARALSKLEPNQRFAACFGWFLAAAVLLLPAGLLAQKRPKQQNPDNRSGYDRSARATVLHTANVYVSADSSAPPITTVTTGHEVVIMARNGPWVNVFANTDAKEDADPDSEPEFKDPTENPDPSSGWIRDKGIVGPTTPNGDVILYGAAADLEAEAAQPHPPQGAAEAAHLLYERVPDYFPNSPLAPEAAFRAADIRWQLDKFDLATLPSAHEQQAFLRPQLYEGALKRVMKLYPGSDIAARAAFDLLDNQLCGDWQGLPKCPEQESNLYLKYASRYPGGPKSAEALYDAAYRQGVLVTMYQVDEDPKRSEAAARNCQAIADEIRKDYPKSDYAERAESIAFRVAQGIPIYGSDRS